MIGESAACNGDPTPEALGSAPCYERFVGTLVVVSRDRGPLVEFDGPEGECRRRTALAVTPIESSAVGRPVELMFVEGDLDRPVITRLVDWQTELWARWAALGRKILGYEPGSWTLEALADECTVLICVAAWFSAHGNITHAAQLIGTSRRSLRQRVNKWKEANPRLVPVRPVKERELELRESRAGAMKAEAEGHAPASAGSSEQGLERNDGTMADG